MRYTVQIGDGYRRQSIDADSPDQAVAIYHQGLTASWPKAIPSETVVFDRRQKRVYDPQQIIDAVAEHYGLTPYDYLALV